MKDDPVAKGLTLSALRAFLTVAEKGGYCPASRGESGTAANLKNQVARLAAAFEVPLFQKSGRSIRITARGEELQRIAADVLRLLGDFRRNCRDEKTLVRIGGGQAMIDELLVPRWADIYKKLPQHRFQFSSLRTAETVEQLLEQRLDFGLVRDTAGGLERLLSKPVQSVEYALCVPRRLLKASGRKAKVPLLKHLPDELPMALLSGDGERSQRLEAFASEHGFKVHALIECTAVSQLVSFLHTGTVVALLPASLAVEDQDIACFRGEEFACFSREVVLVWNAERLKRMAALEGARDVLLRV